MAFAIGSRFPELIIGFISDTGRRIGDLERFHLAKVLTAYDYFRLFTSAPRGQGEQLNCAKLSLNLCCSNLYRGSECALPVQITIFCFCYSFCYLYKLEPTQSKILQSILF